uniref:CSON007038 protein n=1 Tax=Culicoides sonorensis TaxID=179676 RepID=A0A336LWY5_CULSO
MTKAISWICLTIILLLNLSVINSIPVDDGKEIEAVVTPLDVKPSEVQIVQEHSVRQPRSAYYYGYGYKYVPILPYYAYPRYYAPYYGVRPYPYIGLYEFKVVRTSSLSHKDFYLSKALIPYQILLLYFESISDPNNSQYNFEILCHRKLGLQLVQMDPYVQTLPFLTCIWVVVTVQIDRHAPLDQQKRQQLHLSNYNLKYFASDLIYSK